MDILRTQGCFGLSARYSLALEMTSSSFHLSRQKWTSSSYSFLQDVIGMAFEKDAEDFEPTCMDFERAGVNFEPA